MCGIAGALSPDPDRDRGIVDTLNHGQLHRGPDAESLVVRDAFVLANTRLAVQDPTPRSNQPFVDPDGRVSVVFNGEIYNFHELVRRYDLPVRTGCDGEVIALLWARLGPQCLQLFRGMFAMAVADHREGRLFLARDPFGIKPLYWRRFQGAVLFASELKGLWRVDRCLAVSPGSIAEFLRFGAPAADTSPFEGITAVAPGECVSFALPPVATTADADGSVHSIGAAPTGPDEVLRINPLDDVERLRSGGKFELEGRRPLSLLDAFRESVRLHLVADVPTALLLSAGVDSSLIAAAASELGVSLYCLTVTGVLGDDESPQALATATEYGHRHEVVPAAIDDGAVRGFFEAMQRPSIDGLNTFLVSRAVHAAGFKVALSGLGGDEAMAGYSYARLVQLLPALRATDRLPGPTREILMTAVARATRSTAGKRARLLSADGPRTAAQLVALQRELFAEDAVRALGLAPPMPRADARLASDGFDYRDMALAELALYLEPMLLLDTDAFSMAASVELRVPFVDRVFLDAALRRSRFRGKRELVSLMNDRYLELLSRRPKTGFSVPMAAWMRRGVLREVVADAQRPDAPVWDLLDRAVGVPLLRSASAVDRWSAPWSVAALDGWLRSL